MQDQNKEITPELATLIGLSWIFRDLYKLMGDNRSQHDWELIHELVKLEFKLKELKTKSAEGLIDELEYEAGYDRLESRIKEITRHFNWYYYIQPDPRGMHIHISNNVLTDINYNSYQAEAFKVGRLVFNTDDFLTLNNEF